MNDICIWNVLLLKRKQETKKKKIHKNVSKSIK